MKLKEGVILHGLDLSMRQALIIADKVWNGYGQELVITSALEGQHWAGSLHYYGLAIDCRTRYFDEPTKHEVLQDLKQMLGNGFRAVLEPTHIHIERVL